jgi:hypothetical protein
LARITNVVQCYNIRKDGPVVVVVPSRLRKALNITAGTRLLGKIDNKNRLVFTIVGQTADIDG